MGLRVRGCFRQLRVRTSGRALVDITQEVDQIVRASEVSEGVAHVFIRHTSASLLISENADPNVLRDLERFMTDLVPDGDPRFRHTEEGPDDMPSHVRSVLTATSLSIPVRGSALSLGTWQGLFLWEHRHAPHKRVVEVSILGEGCPPRAGASETRG